MNKFETFFESDNATPFYNPYVVEYFTESLLEIFAKHPEIKGIEVDSEYQWQVVYSFIRFKRKKSKLFTISENGHSDRLYISLGVRLKEYEDVINEITQFLTSRGLTHTGEWLEPRFELNKSFNVTKRMILNKRFDRALASGDKQKIVDVGMDYF